jgi:acyl-coenzyme A thioesterase PaaI-like protein
LPATAAVTTGRGRAEGRIIHVGRSTALAEGRLYDVDERLYAVASTTCLILDMDAPRQHSDATVR